MKKSKFSEDQIVKILQEGQSGQTSQAELCRKHGISQGTYYVWKRKYAGMEKGDVKRLRELEAENAALKRIVANQALELEATGRSNARIEYSSDRRIVYFDISLS